MRNSLLAMMLLLGGCTIGQPRPTTAERQAELRQEFAEANARRDAFRERARLEAADRRLAEETSRAARKAEAAELAANAKTLIGPLPPPMDTSFTWKGRMDCRDAEERRLTWPESWRGLPEAVAAYKSWPDAHCWKADHSQMVVKTFQDHRGVLTQRMVPDRGVDTECDSKRPKNPFDIVPSDRREAVAIDIRLLNDCAKSIGSPNG